MRHPWLAAGHVGHRCFPLSSRATSFSPYSRHSASIGKRRCCSIGPRSTLSLFCTSNPAVPSTLQELVYPGFFRDSHSLHLVRWLIVRSGGREVLADHVSYWRGRC